MKNENLFQTNARSVCTLLLVFLFLFCPKILKAEDYPNGYISNGSFKTLIGNPDSRMMASVYETETTVTMKLMAVGYMKANMIDFAFFYDPSVLKLCDQNLDPVEDFNDLQGHTATLDPYLTAKGWLHWGAHKNVGSSFILNNVSGHQLMRSIWYDLAYVGLDPNNLFQVDSGRVQKILECTFLKQTAGLDLANDAIGIGVKTTSVGSNYYQPKFGYDGKFVWYRDVEFSIDDRIINPNIFLYRSGSSVKTDPANNIGPSFATLNGSFLQGAVNLPVSFSILDTTGSALTGKGRLNHDTVKQYGFIYSIANVNIFIDEFSDLLKIEGTNYNVPTAQEISNGTFTRGGYTFYVVIVNDNDGVDETKNYDKQITNLLPNQQYFAWAYKHYNFETSDVYQSVGNKITFTTTDCIALNIGTVFTVEEPICGQDNGKIQMYVTGGSGSYEFSVNDGTYQTYTDDIIDGLTAGTYSITVRDKIQTSCPTATVDDIVLHNSETDLNLFVTSGNAGTCESLDGTLYLSVTGGEAPYKFYLDGVEETVTNGEINNLKAGVYVVNVTDKNGCMATGGEVRITAGNSQLAINNITKVNTVCGKSEGSVSFNVTGSDNFTYQLDGFPEGKGTDNTQIDFAGLTAGVHYLKVWDDCKEVVEVINITNGENALAFTATTQNEIMSCDGSLVEGSITLTVTNGTPVFKYRFDGGDWIDFPNNLATFTIPELHTGIYRVEIQDATDCTYEINQIKIEREIYKPINVGTIFAAVEPTCGQDNGVIQVYTTGGSGEYEYSVNGGSFVAYANGLINNLVAGTYSIEVRDVNFKNCPNVTIDNIVLHSGNTDLMVNVTSSNATTCESTDGTLYISVTGGEAPYKFYLDGTEKTVTNGEISDLKAGVYVVKVTDKNNCVVSSGEVRITATNSLLAINVTAQVNTECGFNTGSVTFNVTGSNNFTYQLDGYPEMTGTNNNSITLNGLTAGVHVLRVWDDCKEVEKEIIITNGINGLAFTATPTNEVLSCNNELTNGSITLNVTHGTANFKYRYDGGEWNNFEAGSTTVTITGLHAGIYRVEVKDATDCTYEVNRITIGREIYTPINVGTIFAAVEPTCGQPNGSIQVFATGGSGEYLYSVNGGNFVDYTDGLITGLSAGTYTIKVQDANFTSCPDVTVNDIVLHNSNSDLAVKVTANNATTCESLTGALVISVTGGQAPYKFYLDGVETPVTNGAIYNLKAGVYVVKVTDKNNCIASSGEVRISANNSALAVNVNAKEDTECGFSTGSVTFNVTGSNDFTYQLDGYPEMKGTDNSAIILTGLNAGVHVLRVWDNCGIVEKEIVITNGTNGLAFTTTKTDETLSCDNLLIGGTITLNVTNGTPNFQYRYDGGEWKNFVAGATTVTINNLHAGTYRVEVKDANDCTYEVNRITIGRDVYTPISIGTIYAAVEPTCEQSNGEIQIYVTGGSGEYLYSVNGGNFGTYTDGIITGLVAGTYSITVQDKNFTSCSTATFHNFVLHNAETDLVVTMTADDALTCTSEDGTLNITVTGGKTPYSYTLNGENVTPVNGKILNQKAGTYVLKVTDIEGCTATSGEVRINGVSSQLAVDIKHVEDTDCGSTTGAITFEVTGSSNYTYQLDGNSEVNASHNNPIVLTGIPAGVHTLKVWDSCAEVEDEIVIISNGLGGLAFTAEAQKEIVSCEGEVKKGSIALTVTSGTPNFKYRFDGGDWIDFPAGSYTTTIPNLNSGIYKVEVIDGTLCMYEVNDIVISHESSYGTLVTPPVATTPQTFCSSAKVLNLQAIGVDVQWYLTAEGGEPLASSELLINGQIYYAAQSLGTCESAVRTAVKVIIDDEVVLETPIIKTPQAFCGTSETLTIADIATNGNTNIVWYDEAVGGNKLSLTDPLEEGFYYAVIEAGTCQSSPRVKVEVIFTTIAPNAPVVETPQSFCEGAFIIDIIVPNNKIEWYIAQTGGDPLPKDFVLQHNTTYYAAQVAGECESETRTPVLVKLDAPDAPVAPAIQPICGKTTIADLVVTGSGIVWYDAEEGGNKLPLDWPLEVGNSYWAAQSSVNCEGERTEITITDACYAVYGTMFPFVKTNDPIFDAKFPVTVKLHNVPEVDGTDPIERILKATAVHTTQATYYDASVYIPTTPLNPGTIGEANNPGLPINWASLGRTVGTVDNTTVTQGQVPNVPVGMFKFENVVPGTYVIEISRQGYITRWGKIEITENGKSLGHRELIAGDVNDDLQIDASDLSNLVNAIGSDDHDPRYDLNGDEEVDMSDVQIIQYNINAYIGTYVETMNWASEY